MKRIAALSIFLSLLAQSVLAQSRPIATRDISDLNGYLLAAYYSNVGAPTSAGTGYAPADLIFMGGGTFTRAAKAAVMTTQVITATVVSVGTGGTNGPVTITGTTGNGTLFQATGTIASNHLTGPLTVTTVGGYTLNPTNIAAEPVTGGSLLGATVSLTLGVASFQITDPGYYTAVPANPISQGSTTGAGSGATFTLTWGPVAAMVDGGILAGPSNAGGNLFMGGSLNNVSSGADELAGNKVSGSENTFIGNKAGSLVTTGFGNTALGHNAMGDGSGAPVTGSDNTFVGRDSGRNVVGVSGGNLGFGSSTLENIFGSGNVAIGLSAMQNSSGGNDNVAIGTASGANINNGQNVFIGSKTVSNNSGNAGDNVIIGYLGGSDLTNGSNNICIGWQCMLTATTGNNNIIIMPNADLPAVGSNNYVNFGGLLFYNNNSTAAPAVTACGSSPSIDSHANNRSGTITVGSGVVASCTVTFAGTGYSTWNHCRVTPHTTIAAFAYSYTKTVLTLTATSLTSDAVDYDCDGY